MDISFEYYPPKTNQGLENLIKTTKKLERFSPEFYSITFGAGGSTQATTLSTATSLKKKFNIVDVAPHISCIRMTKARITSLLERYMKIGIKRLVVLRGDQPSGMLACKHNFNYAYQLVKFIREETGNHFFIEVAAYPETHPETPDTKRHIEHLQLKIDAGANRAITQYFYNADAYFQLVEDCSNIPIVAGIMPITNYTQLARFSHLCGAEIPRWLDIRLKGMADNPAMITAFGEEFVIKLCRQLINGGAPGLHFYTLNKAKATSKILNRLSPQLHPKRLVSSQG